VYYSTPPYHTQDAVIVGGQEQRLVLFFPTALEEEASVANAFLP